MVKMEIEYTKSKNHTTIPVTGVVGCLSPNGFVQCELFVETAQITDNHTLEIDGAGIPIPKETQVTKFNRELQTLLLLAPEVAKNIGKWLIQTAEQAEKAQKSMPRT